MYPGDYGNIRVPYTTSVNMSYDPIIIVVFHDVSLEKITLNTLVLPFHPGYGDKNICIHVRHLCQLLSERDFFQLFSEDLIRVWWRYSKQSSVFFHYWGQVLVIKSETPIRWVPKQNDGLK